MGHSDHTDRAWGWAALPLWCGFFVLGLFPEYFYDLLRAEGRVVTHKAMVNSPYLLYAGLVVYFFAFVSRAARAAGLGPVVSQVLAVQLAMVGLLGFLPVRLEDLPAYWEIPVRSDRWLMLSVCSLKIASWMYLLSLVFRYYLGSGDEVFRQLVPVFPSAHHEKSSPETGESPFKRP